MTLIQLVKERLHLMFVQLAEDIATGEIGDLTPEEAAGIPLALFSAEETMRQAFRHSVTSGDPQETVTCIPSQVIKSIFTILLIAFHTKVLWSDNPLEMAQAAIEQQKTGISRVLSLMKEHCFYPPDPEEPAP